MFTINTTNKIVLLVILIYLYEHTTGCIKLKISILGMLTTNPIKLFAVFSTGQCSTHVITNTHFLIYRNVV